jgi:thiol-disulfide isomerase/thioredoxin
MQIRKRRISFALFLCWMAAADTAMLFAQSKSAPVGKPVEAASGIADLPIVDAAGYQKLIADQRGKYVLVNFWATWCPPCRTEYPELNHIARTFEKDGLVVIGVSQDEDAEINLVRRFLAQHRPIFKNYRAKPGHFTEFTRAVDTKWRGSIPTTFLYDREGRKVTALYGPQTREQFVLAVRKMIALDSTAK